MPEPERRPQAAASDVDAAATRRRRRAVLRAHHPDLGGDPDELIRQLALLDSAGVPVADPEPVAFVRRPRGLRGLALFLRRSRRRRGAIPRVR